MGKAKSDNLKPIRSKNEARERGRDGCLKSGETRRKRKALKEHLLLLLETRQGDMTAAEALTMALFEKALSGDVRAYEVIRDTIGEKPVDKVETELSGGISLRWE